MTNLYYLYNKDTEENYFNMNRFSDEPLGFKVIESGTIIPNKRGKIFLDWWGTGGIFDSKGKFVEGSFPTNTPKEKITKSAETVVYLGLFSPAWGHSLTVNLQYLWFLQSDAFKTEFKNCRLVYLPWSEGKGGHVYITEKKSFVRLLEILGIDVFALQPITQPTRFDKIILPDRAFFNSGGKKFFTAEYREMIDRVRDFALKNRTPTSSKKIYYLYGRHQVGERRIADYFKSKGYEIILPEKLPLDEQLNVLINCESFASTLGSCSHNSLFLPDGAEAIFIPRAPHVFTSYQQTIDQVHPLQVNYVDSSLSLFSGEHGPNCFIISRQLKSFFGDAFDGYESDDFRVFLKYVKDALHKGLDLNRKAKRHYGEMLPDFWAQLKRRPRLVATYDMPTDWQKKIGAPRVAEKPASVINLDYLYSPPAARKFFGNDHFLKKKLSVKSVENGIILPHKREPTNDTSASWWGRGGIADEQGKFIEGSLVSKGTGGTFEPLEDIEKRSETAVYLGLFTPSWGHALTINLQRLWFLQSTVFKRKFKNCPLVYLPWMLSNGEYVRIEQIQNFRRLLEILEIDPDALQPVTRPVRFDSIIMPDKSFFSQKRLYFTAEYRETIDRIKNFALKNQTPTAKKIYYFYGNMQLGEERLAEYFKSKGYAIVQPEKLTTDEQLNLMINAESFASTLGSCAHNSVFLRKGTEAIFIPRSANHFTGYQQAINQVAGLNAKYVDSSLSLFGGIHGPNCFIISPQLKKFFGDTFDGYAEDDLRIFLAYARTAVDFGFKKNENALPYYAPIYQDFTAQLGRRKEVHAHDKP